MLSAEENLRLTSTGDGTAGGRLMRRFWQPVALSDELDGERALRCVTVLGEDFVLFRDEGGRLGLLHRHCPHRGADLGYGRLEDGGLRCIFHGWLFDVRGRCLEQPAEPEGSRFHEYVRQPAYPCVERNGIVFAFLGRGAPPPMPDLDCLAAPRSHSFAFKGRIECNWMQALEVGIDPAHASYLHRFLDDEDPDAGYGRQFRAATALTNMPLTQVLRDFPRPRIVAQETPYGIRIIALRDLDGDTAHVRVTNLLFPHAIVITMSDTMTITQWHVPVDDRRCYWYALFTSFGEPVDHEAMRQQRQALYALPDYVPRIGAAQNYGYDPNEQRTRTYSGMGDDINVHDQWAVESMGALQDRSREHLGHSDVAIRAFRRLLGQAIAHVDDAERAPILGAQGLPRPEQPVAVDAIGHATDWDQVWRERAQQRRDATPWLQP